MSSDEIMTVEEVAKYLKLKPQTVYKWAQEGTIPATKLGKEWRFRRRILDEWIDSQIMESPGAQEMLDRRQRQAVESEKPVSDDNDTPPGARIEELR